jgi:hypothetical protein
MAQRWFLVHPLLIFFFYSNLKQKNWKTSNANSIWRCFLSYTYSLSHSYHLLLARIGAPIRLDIDSKVEVSQNGKKPSSKCSADSRAYLRPINSETLEVGRLKSAS